MIKKKSVDPRFLYDILLGLKALCVMMKFCSLHKLDLIWSIAFCSYKFLTYTANIFEVIFTVFNCVPISTVILLYGLHFIAAPSTV